MSITLHIKDTSSPEAQAFVEYAKSLKFISIEETKLTVKQIQAIEQAKKSLAKTGGTSHDEVMEEMKGLYPGAF